MHSTWLTCLTFGSLATALPSWSTDGLSFGSSVAKQQNLPTVEFPYASYQAVQYLDKGDIYVFKNIRFAAPPTGDLRFAKPAPPQVTPGLQTKAKGGTCLQFLPTQFLTQATYGIGGSVLSELTKAFDFGKMQGGDASSEDCLFLDVYVPGEAMRKKVVVPVVNWIYGGAYVLGNKEKHYNGTAILQASDNRVIYVAGNYRLGAFGWLAGTTVEQDKLATANAGLYDQRAVLEWIQKYIAKFGGDPNDVTVMGESAGGSSIMHHLTAFGGSQDPLFKKAIIQSPAFYPAVWDRKGVNEKNFKVFAVAAGCPNQELDCLRSKSVSVVNRAQQKVVVGVPDGSFGFGPAPDGAMVRQLPQLELLTGNYWKGIDSLIVSHMTREADNFISKDPKRASDAYFMNMVNEHFNNNTDVSKALKRQLPLAKFQTPRDRMIQYAQDAVFVCNTRFISQAYQNKTYNFVMEGVHGRDVFANFYSKGGMAERVLADTIGSSQAFKFQRYITSMIRSGNPNTFRSEGSPEWPKGVVAEDIENTLRIGKNFTFFKDSANGADECDIWLDLFAAVTNGGGYAPPGGRFESRLGEIKPDPSVGSAEDETSRVSSTSPIV